MGRVVHFEIHATDPERLAAFYRDLFGWTVQRWDGPMDYWMVMTGDDAQPGIHGGLMRRHGDAPSDGQPVNAFVCTVDVADLDATLERAVALGGSIALPRQAVPGVGWLAYVKDPDGTIVGALQADEDAS